MAAEVLTAGRGGVAEAVPEGYGVARIGRARVVALEDVLETVANLVREAGSIQGWAGRSPDAKAMAGRGVSWAFSVGGHDWVVRHYRRGGAIARILRDRYLKLGATRPARELRASIAARAKGIRTPGVVAYAVYPAGAHYRADIVTRWIRGAEDLAAVTWGADARTAEQRAAAWSATGRLLATAFTGGLRHPDLNLRNILISGDRGAPEAWLIDLDRCRVREQLRHGERRQMLERFHRSRRKLERQFARPVDADSLSAFHAGLND